MVSQPSPFRICSGAEELGTVPPTPLCIPTPRQPPRDGGSPSLLTQGWPCPPSQAVCARCTCETCGCTGTRDPATQGKGLPAPAQACTWPTWSHLQLRPQVSGFGSALRGRGVWGHPVYAFAGVARGPGRPQPGKSQRDRLLTLLRLHRADGVRLTPCNPPGAGQPVLFVVLWPARHWSPQG